MATVSFDLDIVLDADEAVPNFLNDLDIIDRKGHIELPDLFEELRIGRDFFAKGCPFDD
jgi:hypothetical protein